MTDRIASLGMYDRPELHAANDALLTAIAAHLVDAGIERVPAKLDRSRSLAEIWDDPDLLLAQCCGYPLVTAWQGRLRYVATPRYRAPGCEDSDHRSRIVIGRDDPATSLSDFRGRRAAINERTSNTGMNLLRAAIAPLAAGQPFFGAVMETGSHAASARLIAGGDADIAAIDTVSFAHIEHSEPDVTGRLRTLGWTPAVPGLPLVTSQTTTTRQIAALRNALRHIAEEAVLADARSALLLDGIDVLKRSRYDVITTLETKAIRAGYPLLA